MGSLMNSLDDVDVHQSLETNRRTSKSFALLHERVTPIVNGGNFTSIEEGELLERLVGDKRSFYALCIERIGIHEINKNASP